MMHILRILTKPISIIYPYKMYCLVNKVLDRLYTSWISEAFASFGNDCIIRRPFKLVGGVKLILVDMF